MDWWDWMDEGDLRGEDMVEVVECKIRGGD
jgi:hypothetical protein